MNNGGLSESNMNPVAESMDLFNETWDLSMSTLPDFVDQNKCTTVGFTPLSNVWNDDTRSTFFELPRQVELLIHKYKGIDKLYDWQIDCLNLPAIRERKNLVYSLPTSGGKTLVAEILMIRELLVNKKNVIFVLPYVALAQEKVRSLSPFGLDLEFYVEEYVAGKGKFPPTKHYKKRSIYVCTTEKAAGLIESLLDASRLHEIGMMVVDEIHLIGEPSRGPVLEMMLTQLMLVTKDIHIIAMSATIGNLDEIGTFLNAQVYTHDFRPVELEEYIKCGNTVYKINRNAQNNCYLTVDRELDYKYTPELLKIDPSLLGGLVQEVIPNESCLVFCPIKKQCDYFAQLVCKCVNRNFKEMRKDEKMALLRALAEEGQGVVCPTLTKTIPYGVAYHHSGLTNAERKLIEEAYIVGTIHCICCTSTLAAGINLPAKRVIIISPYVGISFMKLSMYKQMSGRAGRMGFTNAGESYLLCQDADMPKVKRLLKSAMDRCDSKMNADSFIRLTTYAVGLKVANSKPRLKDLFDLTLFRIQNGENGANVEKLVEKSVNELIETEGLEKVNEDEYVLTKIATAAITANLTVTEARMVLDELLDAAEKGFILKNYLHLFYLVTPLTAAEDVNLERQTILDVMNELSPEETIIAERLGITELCLIQFTRDGKVTAVNELVWNRFLRALIIYDLWNKHSIWDVSNKFNVPRGTIHSFLLRVSGFATSIQRFTEALNMEYVEYVPALLQKIIPRISYCCTSELLQLMQLPGVKIGRAKQLYKAGYKTLQHIVNAEPMQLVRKIDHLPRRVAYEIVAAAKLLLLEKAETLQEEADIIKAELNEKLPEDLSFASVECFSISRFSTPQPKKPRL